MTATEQYPAAQVLGISVDAIDMEEGLRHVGSLLRGERKGYVCVAGVHGIMEAQRDPDLFRAYRLSEMTIPDGMPLVWVGRTQGYPRMERVTGPDLMLEIFRRKEFANVTHYLYGGAEGVAETLRENLHGWFPWARIVGIYTPPYTDLSIERCDSWLAEIDRLKPDIIWVGISCPKQELFMSRYLPRLNTRLMFGVGAAFDYHTGRIRDCDAWVKRAGLQWLHRLLQDPRRLWKRYARNNPAFLWRIALQMLAGRRSPHVSPAQAQEKRHHAEAR